MPERYIPVFDLLFRLEPLLIQGQDLADMVGNQELDTQFYAARQKLEKLITMDKDPKEKEAERKLDWVLENKIKINKGYCRSCGRPSDTKICKYCGYESLNV